MKPSPRSVFVRTLNLVLLGTVLVSAAQAEAIKVGVLLKGHNAFWTQLEKGALAGAQKTGAEVIIKSTLWETDVGPQIQLMKALEAQGIQALAIAPTSDAALLAPLKALAAKGVKIIVLDSPPFPPELPHVCIATDHKAAGTAAGTLLAGMVGDNDHVALLRNVQGATASEDRETSAIAALHSLKPSVQIAAEIYALTERGTEQAKAALLLEKHPDTTTIFSSSTPGSKAMLTVLQQKGLVGKIKLVGFGAALPESMAKGLEAGEVEAWIAHQPFEIGRLGVETAVAIIKGEKVEPVIHPDFIIIHKEDLQKPAVQALLTP